MEHYPEFVPADIIPQEVVRQSLKRCGVNVRVYRGCRFSSPDRIEIGDYSQIDEGVYLFAGDGIVIGRHVHLAFSSSISGGGRCEICDFASIGSGVRIITGSDVIDGSGLTNPTVPAEMRSVARGKVVIGAHAVIFTNTVVLPNVTIGDGAVVSARAVVHHDLKPWGIYAGHPLTQIGIRPKEKIQTLAEQLAAGS